MIIKIISQIYITSSIVFLNILKKLNFLQKKYSMIKIIKTFYNYLGTKEIYFGYFLKNNLILKYFSLITILILPSKNIKITNNIVRKLDKVH